jgi:hypothetical protein
VTRRRTLVAAGAVLALADLGAAWVRVRGSHPHASARDAIPEDAFVAVDIDLDMLRASGALAQLLGNGDAQSVTKLCGFDPVERMHELVFALPQAEHGDFGVAVQAEFKQDELLACASKILESRGAEASPEVVTRGSFKIVSQRAGEDGKVRPSLAYREGGPYLVGVGEWLARMVDAVDHPSKGTAPNRAALPGTPAGSTSPLPRFAVTATVVLEKTIREKVKAEMIDELAEGEAAGPPSERAVTMAGVLGVSSAALGLYEQGAEMHVVAELSCETSAACSSVAKLIWRKQEVWSKDRTLRMLGVGPILDHLEVDNHDARLELRAVAPSSQVVEWVKALLYPSASRAPRSPSPPLPMALPSSLSSAIRAHPP